MHRDLAAILNLEIAYEGGIKIKNGTWSAPMSYPESFAMLVKMVRDKGLELPTYLRSLA